MFENIISDLPLILYSWLLVSLWQFIAAPFLIILTKKYLPDGGWAWGRIIGWLSIGLIVWVLSHLGLPINTISGVWLVFALLGLYSFGFFQKNKKEIVSFIHKNKELIITQELLFLFGFVFLSIVRGFHPDILDLEKFMDAGLMVVYTKSATLPAPDVWLAGETINYYTFGHFLGGLLTNFWRLDIAYSYNLALGFLFGLLLMQSFSMVTILLGPLFIDSKKTKMKPLILSGLIGSLLVGFGGNSHIIWYFLKNHTMDGYWYPDATRFIHNTIHEFPAYSFVVSDLHAHVWSLLIVLLAIMFTWLWLKFIMDEYQSKKKFLDFSYIKLSILVGVIIGVLIMTSAWDAAIYSLLLAVLGVVLLLIDRKFFLPLIYSAGLVFITMILTSSFWWLNFTSISNGIELVVERSPLKDMAILWTTHFLSSALALFFAVTQLVRFSKNKVSHTFVFIIGMVFTAWLLLLLPELIYVKDIYPDHPRANTMFKLTFQASLLMTLVIAWLSGFIQLKNKFDKPTRIVLVMLVSMVVISLSSYSLFSYKSYYNFSSGSYVGLNGLSWFENKYPDDYQAYLWMKENIKGQPHILEAVGESYTEFARISSFTGFPTVLGWRVHEWLWRGGFEIPGQRTEEVRIMYEDPSSDEAKRLLRQYNVRYIFVGDKEREAYSLLNDSSLAELGTVVYHRGMTIVIALF